MCPKFLEWWLFFKILNNISSAKMPNAFTPWPTCMFSHDMDFRNYLSHKRSRKEVDDSASIFLSMHTLIHNYVLLITCRINLAKISISATYLARFTCKFLQQARTHWPQFWPFFSPLVTPPSTLVKPLPFFQIMAGMCWGSLMFRPPRSTCGTAGQHIYQDMMSLVPNCSLHLWLTAKWRLGDAEALKCWCKAPSNPD